MKQIFAILSVVLSLQLSKSYQLCLKKKKKKNPWCAFQLKNAIIQQCYILLGFCDLIFLILLLAIVVQDQRNAWCVSRLLRCFRQSPSAFFMHSVDTPQGPVLKYTFIPFYNNYLSQVIHALQYPDDTNLPISLLQYYLLQRVFSNGYVLSYNKYISLPSFFNL